MMKSIFHGFKDILYPRICLACKKRLTGTAYVDGFICTGCWKALKRNVPPFCHTCGKQVEAGKTGSNTCPACIDKTMHFNRAFSPYSYDGAIKELIHQFKYNGKDYLGEPLGNIIANFLKEHDFAMSSVDAIVPVPLHASRLREREFNQAEILGRHIAKAFRKNLLTSALYRHKNTHTQTELAHHERLNNVLSGFEVRNTESVRNMNLLLVDDVLTTGSTSSEAARALKNAGANTVNVVTLAN